MNSLFNNAPGFDQPVAVLKHCHDRIRKQLDTLDKLLEHLPRHGCDEQAMQAAKAVLRYFTEAAPLHHEDEEVDLLPTLQMTATGEDAALLQEYLPLILAQHHQMAAQWAVLEQQLQAIAKAESADLSENDVAQFKEIYAGHMQIEETQIAPMAMRIFSETQMRKLGAAMQQRRGIANT
ncbi:MAG: hemerythrin domain-containing protein [Pseudomonadota bacterium]